MTVIPKPCQTPGCPNITRRGSRCAGCETEYQHTRNTRRGGGTHRADHARARAQLQPIVDAGTGCYRCGELINPDVEGWDADQTIDGWQASHATCNRSAGGRSGRGG